MAGDWIKLEHATPDKPEIAIASEMLGLGLGDTFLLLVRYWIWLDQNLSRSCPGVVPFVSRKSLERRFQCEGLAAILEHIGWAKFDDTKQLLTVVNSEYHNGKTAKTRALEQRKKSRQRDICPDFVPIYTGPEKRREEKNKELTTLSGKPDVVPIERATAKQLLERLNSLTGHHYKAVTANLDPILARLREGYSERDIRVVIARKVQQWGPDEKMAAYLRPKTLFNRTNFANYAGEIPPEEKAAHEA